MLAPTRIMAQLILDCELMKHPFSGLYTYCLNLGEHLNTELRAAGRDPLLMYLPPRRKLRLPAEPHHLPERRWHRLMQPFLRDCRVWHAPFQSGRLLPDKRRYPNLNVVLTVHDLNVLHEGKSPADQQRSLAHTQALIDQSDAIVCISAFTRSDVLTHCDTGSKPVQVIYNGAGAVAAPPAMPPAGAPPGPFVLGIGYLNRKKNFHVLLPLLADNPDLSLVLVGRPDDPDYVAQLRGTAQALGVSDRLHLPGPVSEADKSWYLHHCQALLHPSLAEGFGLPVVEAMQLGKPVFLSRHTALPEIGGRAAAYFADEEPDTVQAVFRQARPDFQAADQVAARRAQAARFTWAVSARQYLAVYDSLLG